MEKVMVEFRINDIKELEGEKGFEVGEFENFVWNIVNKTLDNTAGEIESDTCIKCNENRYWIGITTEKHIDDKLLREIKEDLEEHICVCNTDTEILKDGIWETV